jgi:sugar lactone lactonase YvrE
MILARLSVWRLAIPMMAVACGQALSGQILYITEVAPTEKVVAYNLATLQPYDVGTSLTAGLYVPSGHLEGIATDSSGNVYVAYDYYINKYDNTGAIVTTFGTNGQYYTGNNSIVTGGTVNPAGTEILVPYNLYTSNVQAFNTSTGAPVPGFTPANVFYGSPPTTAGTPWAVAFNPSGTYFYVTAPSGVSGGTTITQFSTSGGTGTLITPLTYPTGSGGYGGADGLLFQTDNTFVVENVNLGTVSRYTISGSNATLDTSFGVNGSITGLSPLNGGMTADASGNLYFFVAGASTSTIAEYTANGQLINSALLTLPGNNNYAGHLAIGTAFVAVPEPSVAAMLAIGTLALGFIQLRRRLG